jgi:Anti-sigma factor NepR
MARRPNTRSAFETVRTAIGAELKRLYSDVLHEPIPDAMGELLKQLDHPPTSDQNTETRPASKSGKILDE